MLFNEQEAKWKVEECSNDLDYSWHKGYVERVQEESVAIGESENVP